MWVFRDYKWYTLYGEIYSPILYESINIIDYILKVKGELSKISLSSFKYPLSHYSSNETNKLLGHYLAVLLEGNGSIIVPKTINGIIITP